VTAEVSEWCLYQLLSWEHLCDRASAVVSFPDFHRARSDQHSNNYSYSNLLRLTKYTGVL